MNYQTIYASGTGTATTENTLSIRGDLSRTFPQAICPPAIVQTSVGLTMHPANRPLREKAREEMSEFERTYPW